MKTAFSTLACPHWTWEEILAAARYFSFDGIELRGLEGELSAPEMKIFSPQCLPETLSLLRKMKLEIPLLASGVCLGTEGFVSPQKEGRAYIDLAAQIHAPFIRVLISAVPNPSPILFKQAKHHYQTLCEYGVQKKVGVLVETSGPLAESAEMLRFLEGADCRSAGVLWDIHHPCRYFQETPEETFRQLEGFIRFVHIKDSRMSGQRVEYCRLGEGDIPVFRALRLLAKHQYGGYLSLEWVKQWVPGLEEPDLILGEFQRKLADCFACV